MKVLRYFILLSFIFSIFNCVSVSTNKFPQFISEDSMSYDLWFKEHSWIMTGPEKKSWKSAKSDNAREQIIEQFWKARDPDRFTAKNEFKVNYQQDLEKVRKEYSGLKDFLEDSRCRIYLLFGEPNTKRVFTDQAVSILDFGIQIRVSKTEIWRYNDGKERYQVIFAKFNPDQLERIRDQRMGEFSQVLFSSSRFEILYMGTERFTDIVDFLQSFFQGGSRLEATSDIINRQKKPILERAKEFYKKSQPRVKKERYVYELKTGLKVSITQFDINSPEEVGIDIWFLFDKDFLYYDSKKKEHKAEISVYCDMKDRNNKKIIHYRDDKVEYKFKKAQSFWYHFWGSLPSGNYKFVIEVGDNIGKRYIKIEEFAREVNEGMIKKDIINIRDYSKPGLDVTILIGKAVQERGRIKEKPGYSLQFKKGTFCPVGSGEIFQADGELIAVFDISGFGKNHYGNSCLELGLSFENIETGEIYRYALPTIEKDGSRFRNSVNIKSQDFNNRFKIPPGLYQYKVVLSIRDAITDKPYILEYPRSIRILSTNVKAINENNIIRRRD